VTGIFMYLSLPTADITIVYNARILFVKQCSVSCNMIVRWFADIDVCFFFFFLADMGVYFSIFSFFYTVLCILYFKYGLLYEINMDGWMDG